MNRYKNIRTGFPLLLFLLLWKVTLMLRNPTVFSAQRNDTEQQQQYFVIISAVYSAKSRLYADNQFVLLLIAPKSDLVGRTKLVAKTANGTDLLLTDFMVHQAAAQEDYCHWEAYMGTFESVSQPHSLQIGYREKLLVPVEIQRPYLKKRVQVGACFSPLFYIEHWQLVYAAEFLIVGDFDDILVPDHGTYYDEFIRIAVPTAAALVYNRFHVHITTTRNASYFSLFDTLMSAKVNVHIPLTPKYVANTARAESLWIHSPYIVQSNCIFQNVPVMEGRMFHLREWNFLEDNEAAGYNKSIYEKMIALTAVIFAVSAFVASQPPVFQGGGSLREGGQFGGPPPPFGANQMRASASTECSEEDQMQGGFGGGGNDYGGGFGGQFQGASGGGGGGMDIDVDVDVEESSEEQKRRRKRQSGFGEMIQKFQNFFGRNSRGDTPRSSSQQGPRSAPPASSCNSCTTASLRTLTAAEAVAAGMLQAISTNAPTGTSGTNSAGCSTLTLTCAAGQVVTIHVILANRDTDFGNYDSGVLSLECSNNAQSQWLVPANAQHPGDVVDGYACVTSNLG
ncbi:hypothetical protein GPALN_005071 [Globodera pallida]|nr:hypothetical protein GPALN_005071 [Globodera pallida]